MVYLFVITRLVTGIIIRLAMSTNRLLVDRIVTLTMSGATEGDDNILDPDLAAIACLTEDCLTCLLGFSLATFQVDALVKATASLAVVLVTATGARFPRRGVEYGPVHHVLVEVPLDDVDLGIDLSIDLRIDLSPHLSIDLGIHCVDKSLNLEGLFARLLGLVAVIRVSLTMS